VLVRVGLNDFFSGHGPFFLAWHLPTPGLRLHTAITSFSAPALPHFDLVAFFAGVSIAATAKLSSSASLLAVNLDTSSSLTSVFSS
jgi:hypothetical protein